MTRIRSLIRVLAAHVVAAAAAHAQAPRDPGIDALFARWNGNDGPGCAVLVTRGGELVHRAGYGVRDIDTGEPITADTPIYAASASKQFTAACVALLAARGELSLDDDVREHVPEIPDYGAKITVRDLIHHRSGLRDFFELMVLAGWDLDAPTSPERVLELVARQKALNFEPGSDFLYSNTGYLLLAEIVERVSGRSLREFAREHVFEPLGMSRTTFRDDPSQAIDGVAVGHERARSGYRARRTAFALPGSGGLYTTVSDFGRWLDNLDAGGETWGGPELVALLQTPPVLRPEQGRSPELGDYAFGLIVRDYRGIPAVGHPGGSFGYQASSLRFPAQRVSIVVLANASDVPADDLGYRIADVVLAEEFAARRAADGEPEAATRRAPGFCVYRDPASGEIAVLSTRPDGSSRLATLSYKVLLRGVDGGFAAVDSALPLEARFVGDDDSGLDVRVAGGSARRYLELPRPGRIEVASFAGDYRSDELDASLHLEVDGGRLRIDDSELAMPIPPFMPVATDTFVSDRGVQLDFVRGADGELSGMRVSTGRARGIVFVRVE